MIEAIILHFPLGDYILIFLNFRLRFRSTNFHLRLSLLALFITRHREFIAWLDDALAQSDRDPSSRYSGRSRTDLCVDHKIAAAPFLTEGLKNLLEGAN